MAERSSNTLPQDQIRKTANDIRQRWFRLLVLEGEKNRIVLSRRGFRVDVSGATWGPDGSFGIARRIPGGEETLNVWGNGRRSTPAMIHYAKEKATGSNSYEPVRDEHDNQAAEDEINRMTHEAEEICGIS